MCSFKMLFVHWEVKVFYTFISDCAEKMNEKFPWHYHVSSGDFLSVNRYFGR